MRFTNIETSYQRGLGKKGKAAFREAFGRVAELRSCLETGMPLLGLTATANKEMRDRLIKCLGLKTCSLITVSPNKDNIRFSVLQADKQLHCFNWLLSLLRIEKENTPFTIIFCKTVNDIVSLLTFFLMKLGNSGLYVNGEGPIHERCLLGVYYSQTPKRHKDYVTSSFEGVSGNVRVVLATTSLSMGVDFPHVKYVIHYGPSNNLTSHLQEAGRGGRDGNQAYHITVYQGRHLTTCEADIKNAVRNSLKSCCRVEFLSGFDDTISPLEPLHDCCSVCHKICNCIGDHCSNLVPDFDVVPENTEGTKESREVSEDDKECIKKALKEVQRSLSCQSRVRMFDDTGIIAHGLSDKMIDKIVSNVHVVYNVYDVIEHCKPPSLKVAVIILEIFREVFEDVEVTDELYSLVYTKDQTHLLNKVNASLESTYDLDLCEDLDADDFLESVEDLLL